MNGFLVGNPGDVEKQKLFVERLGDFVVTKHLPLEHRLTATAIAPVTRLRIARRQNVTNLSDTRESGLCRLSLQLRG